MAGYHGYIMSNSAVAAYQDGEKPISKWSKAEILDACGPRAAELKKLTVKELRAHLLTKTSWHHTSSRFNATNFYSVDPDAVDTIDVDAIIARRKPPEPKPEGRTITAEISYTHWIGSRRHPRPVECQEVATFRSTDKMIQTAHGNKRMTSVRILREV